MGDLISRSELMRRVSQEEYNNDIHMDGRAKAIHHGEYQHFRKVIAEMPAASDSESVIPLDWELITRLLNCFPNSLINQRGEFIANVKSNDYFILRDCKTEIDVKCKVLEWLSRSAFKTEPYRRKDKNDEFHRFMRGGIIEFLGVHFSESDMELIYTYLGNACDHEKTVRFVECGYDMKILQSC